MRDNLRYVFVNAAAEAGWRLVMLLSIVVMVFAFRKKIKGKNEETSLQLFDVMSFLLLFCGAVLPVAVTLIYGAYEVVDLFSVVTVVLFILLCRTFADRGFLKYMTYAYTAIPMVILSVFGMIYLYYERMDLVLAPYGFVLAFGYVKSFFYILYPAAGCFLLSLSMKK